MKHRVLNFFLVACILFAITSCLLESPHNWPLTPDEIKWKASMELTHQCDVGIEKGATYGGVNEVRDSSFGVYFYNLRDTSFKPNNLSIFSLETARSFSKVMEKSDEVRYIEVVFKYTESRIYDLLKDSIVR